MFTPNQILPTLSYQVTRNVVAYKNLLTLLARECYVPVQLTHSCLMDIITIPYNRNWNFSTSFCKCGNGVERHAQLPCTWSAFLCLCNNWSLDFFKVTLLTSVLQVEYLCMHELDYAMQFYVWVWWHVKNNIRLKRV